MEEHQPIHLVSNAGQLSTQGHPLQVGKEVYACGLLATDDLPGTFRRKNKELEFLSGRGSHRVRKPSPSTIMSDSYLYLYSLYTIKSFMAKSRLGMVKSLLWSVKARFWLLKSSLFWCLNPYFWWSNIKSHFLHPCPTSRSLRSSGVHSRARVRVGMGEPKALKDSQGTGYLWLPFRTIVLIFHFPTFPTDCEEVQC